MSHTPASYSSEWKSREPRSLARLAEIVWAATVPLRTGPEKTTYIAGNLKVEEVMDFLTVEEGQATLNTVKTYDMALFHVGILPQADSLKADFMEALRAYPEMERLAGGPTYIELGYTLQDVDDQAQQVAIQMIALGEYYNLWKAMTPARLGIQDGGATAMAQSGFIMPVGFKIEFLEQPAT